MYNTVYHGTVNTASVMMRAVGPTEASDRTVAEFSTFVIYRGRNVFRAMPNNVELPESADSLVRQRIVRRARVIRVSPDGMHNRIFCITFESKKLLILLKNVLMDWSDGAISGI